MKTKITRFSECKQYFPPKHDVTIHGMLLQHRDTGCEAPYWVGSSYYLPGSKCEMDASPLDKIYVMLDGELTITLEDGSVETIAKGDSIWIGPNVTREVKNNTNAVATMLVIMPYPPEA